MEKIESPKKNTNKNLGCTFLAMILIAILVFIFTQSGTLNESEDAYYTSQEYIKKLLKSPATATFPEYDLKYIHNTGQTYQIDAFVDSQNSFGAMLRSTYQVQLTKVDKGWRIDQCLLNGKRQY